MLLSKWRAIAQIRFLKPLKNFLKDAENRFIKTEKLSLPIYL